MEEFLTTVPLLVPLADAFLAHPYAFIFWGMFVAGETVFLPAVYFAMRGMFNITDIFLLMILASMTSDAVWYILGRLFPGGAFNWVPSARVKQTIQRISDAYEKRTLLLLYFSKFVYGTRTAVQILAGAYRVPAPSWLLVNSLGTLTLGAVYIGIIRWIEVTTNSFDDIIHDTRIGFVLFVAAIVALHLAISYGVNKWYR